MRTDHIGRGANGGDESVLAVAPAVVFIFPAFGAPPQGARHLQKHANKRRALEHTKSPTISLGRTLFDSAFNPSFTSKSNSSNGMLVTTIDGARLVRIFSMLHIVSLNCTFSDTKIYSHTTGRTIGFQSPSMCAPTVELRCPPIPLPRGADGETAPVCG